MWWYTIDTSKLIPWMHLELCFHFFKLHLLYLLPCACSQCKYYFDYQYILMCWPLKAQYLISTMKSITLSNEWNLWFPWSMKEILRKDIQKKAHERISWKFKRVTLNSMITVSFCFFTKNPNLISLKLLLVVNHVKH